MITTLGVIGVLDGITGGFIHPMGTPKYVLAGAIHWLTPTDTHMSTCSYGLAQGIPNQEQTK